MRRIVEYFKNGNVLIREEGGYSVKALSRAMSQDNWMEEMPTEVRSWCDQHQGEDKVKDNPPSWVTDEASWERAKGIVEPNADKYDNKWAVIAYVYNQLTAK